MSRCQITVAVLEGRRAAVMQVVHDWRRILDVFGWKGLSELFDNFHLVPARGNRRRRRKRIKKHLRRAIGYELQRAGLRIQVHGRR